MKDRMNQGLKIWVFTVLVLLVPFTAYYIFTLVESSYASLPYYGPPEEDGSEHTIPPFELINHDGQKISQSDLDGKITVANYFFTSCPSICPTMTRNLKSVQDLYNDDEMVQIFSYTVDPKRDTPEKMTRFAEKFAVQLGQWQFITGDKIDLYRLARNGYMVSATDGDGGPSDFIHSENLVLVDKQRKVRGFYDGTSVEQVEKLIKDIAKLKKDKA